MVISVSNGTTKYLGSSNSILEATWAPNGESLIFREGSGLKIYSLKENDARTLYQTPAGYPLSELRWSPDGNRIVATGKSISSARAPMYEYWIMENFLPK